LTERTLRSLLPKAEAARDAHRAAGHDQHLCLDADYDYAQVREVAAELSYTAHIWPRSEEAQAKKASQKAWRWVVERTHSWLNRFRHLLTRWAKKPEYYLAMLHFTFARTTLITYLNSLLVDVGKQIGTNKKAELAPSQLRFFIYQILYLLHVFFKIFQCPT